MDSLLQLSDIACQAERLTEEKTISSNSSESSSQSSSSASSTPENVVVPQLPKDALAPRSFSCSSQIRYSFFFSSFFSLYIIIFSLFF